MKCSVVFKIVETTEILERKLEKVLDYFVDNVCKCIQVKRFEDETSLSQLLLFQYPEWTAKGSGMGMGSTWKSRLAKRQ